jgi:hypothetical protein
MGFSEQDLAGLRYDATRGDYLIIGDDSGWDASMPDVYEADGALYVSADAVAESAQAQRVDRMKGIDHA